jgi:hypothetical protein
VSRCGVLHYVVLITYSVPGSSALGTVSQRTGTYAGLAPPHPGLLKVLWQQ